MRTNPEGLDIIKRYESCELAPYLDSGHVPTQGWGHTAGVTMASPRCTQEQADAWLAEDLAGAERAVARMVSAPLNENQFSALASLAFNIGAGAFRNSTMRALINGRSWLEAAAEFPLWVHDGGRVLPGLVKRRADERSLFLKPVVVAING